MSTIVTTQAELDAALKNATYETYIEIRSEKGVWLEVGTSKATVSAFGSATVRAFGSATVSAFGSATVSARRAGVGMSTNTVKATTPIAMYAVAQHMLDNQLPAPTTIDAPRAILGENAIIVYVDSSAATAWLDSMVVDDERFNPSEYLGTLEHVTYDGRIQAVLGEIRIQLRTMRRTVPLHLVEVTAS